MLLAMVPNAAMAQKKSAKKTRVERNNKKAAKKQKDDEEEYQTVKVTELKIVDDENDNYEAVKDVDDEDVIFKSVEQMPQFPGGEVALMKYLSTHINYPPEAAKNKIQGRVILQFVVKTNGCVGEVKVVRSVDQDLDNEAIRVVKSLPKFSPGRQNGKAVNVWYTLPVSFKLREPQTDQAQPAE